MPLFDGSILFKIKDMAKMLSADKKSSTANRIRRIRTSCGLKV
jgi:hypothetical protein